MANIVITSKGDNGIYVDFGVYASSELLSPQGFNASNIEQIEPSGTDSAKVTMDGHTMHRWVVSWQAESGSMIIDTIDGSGLSSQTDLIDKLTALM